MSRQPPQQQPLRQPGVGLRRPTQETTIRFDNSHRPQPSKDDEKGGAFGMMLSGDVSDDDDDHEPPPTAPTRMPQRPPPAMQNSRPPPGLGPPGSGPAPPQPVQSPPPPGPVNRPTQTLQPQPAPPRAAFMPLPPLLRPGTAEPHPLQIPSTPIVAKFTQHEDVAKNRITVFGDEFWGRFNKADSNEKKRGSQGQSSFLREYGGAERRFSKWVWCCSIVLLVAIAGGIAAGWYFSRNDPTTKPEVIVGDGAGQNSLGSSGKALETSTSAKASQTSSTAARRRHLRRLADIHNLD